MQTNRRAAFTLIEIMIVVAVIGMLLAVAVPNLHQAIAQARERTCALNRKNINAAKVRWALARNEADTAVPPENELFGRAGLLEPKPECPAGGTYGIGAVQERCQCSTPSHANQPLE